MLATLIGCLALCVNCAYAVAALSAARRYGIAMSLSRGAALAIIALGTLAEVAAIVSAQNGLTQVLLFIAFGSVVIGAACDAACGYVFDAVTLPCLALTLLVSAVWQSFGDVVLGILCAGSVMMLPYVCTRARGLGLGDVKLACCIGAAAGVSKGIEALGAAFIACGVYAAFLLFTKRAHFGAELRFAPYLAAGMAAVLLHGGA